MIYLLLAVSLTAAQAQVPVFYHQWGAKTFTLAGADPARSVTTSIPTVLVPVRLTFGVGGKPVSLDGSGGMASIVASPLFKPHPFSGAPTQYADGLLRAAIPGANPAWHTQLAKPVVNQALEIAVPVGSGYVLTSAKSGHAAAIVDLEFLQKEIFKRVARQPGALVIAVTANTAFYALGDATVCCSWGTHGVDSATGNSFVLASFLKNAPTVIEDQDIQPLTQQLAEFFLDPLHDPLLHTGRNAQGPGNAVPAWTRPGEGRGCGGTGIASTYFLLEPTDTTPKTISRDRLRLPRVAIICRTSHCQTGTWATPGRPIVFLIPKPCQVRRHPAADAAEMAAARVRRWRPFHKPASLTATN